MVLLTSNPSYFSLLVLPYSVYGPLSMVQYGHSNLCPANRKGEEQEGCVTSLKEDFVYVQQASPREAEESLFWAAICPPKSQNFKEKEIKIRVN